MTFESPSANALGTHLSRDLPLPASRHRPQAAARRVAAVSLALIASTLLSGCGVLRSVGLGSRDVPAVAAPQVDEETKAVLNAKADLDSLRATPELAALVKSEIEDAEKALKLGLNPDADPALAQHQRYMAEKLVHLACARASERQMLARLQALAKSSGDKRLASITNPDQVREPLTPPPKLNTPSPDDLKPARSRTATTLNALTLPDSVFSAGGQSLSRDGAQALNGIAASLQVAAKGKSLPASTSPANAGKSPSDSRTIVIRAYSSATANDDGALAIARAKAETVRKALIDLGIDDTRISTEARAELPVAGTTAAPRPPRVEIKVDSPPML